MTREGTASPESPAKEEDSTAQTNTHSPEEMKAETEKEKEES